MSRVSSRRPILCFVVAALAGCGGGNSTAQPPGPPQDEASRPGGGESRETEPDVERAEPQTIPPMPEGIAGPETPWEQMSAEQRADHMADHVVSTMGPLFAAFDSHEFREVRCRTCHGSHARETHFRMPSPEVSPLPRWGTPAWERMTRERPHTVEFMATRVKPAMARLLGLPEMGPDTPQGLGCSNCHTTRD